MGLPDYGLAVAGMWKAGLPLTDIAGKLKITESAVRWHLRKLGLKKRAHGRPNGVKSDVFKQRLARVKIYGACKHCGIILLGGGRPADSTMPCNVRGCPYEDPESQRPLTYGDIVMLAGLGR